MKTLRSFAWVLLLAAVACGRSNTVENLRLEPSTFTLALGESHSVSAIATFGDGTEQDVSGQVDWETTDATVAAVDHDASGKVTLRAVGGGTAGFSAQAGGHRALGSVTVLGSQLLSLDVAPQDLLLPKDATRQLSAVGHFADGSTLDVTTAVAWSSSAPAVASVNGAGLVTARSAGDATVTASLQGVTGSTHVTVSGQVLEAITVSPGAVTLATGQDQLFTALGTFGDGSTADLTTTASWTSSDPSVATMSGNRAHALSQGAATVTASVGGVSGTALLFVSAPTLVSVEVSPAALTLARSTSGQLSATAFFSDGSRQDVTATAAWTSTDASIASVSAGRVTGLNAGQVKITAAFGGQTGVAVVSVTAATLVSFEISPPAATLAVNTTAQLEAVGHFSDGSTQGLNAQAVWSSASPAIATVAAGLVTGVSAGNTSVTATALGQSATAPVTVTSATLVSLEVSPPAPSVGTGGVVQLAAVGHFSDGSTQVLTGQAAWSSSSALVATVSDVAPTKGLATGVSAGVVTVTARVGNVTGSTPLTVTPAFVKLLQVQPLTATLGVGRAVQLTVTAYWSDGTQSDVTAASTWSVANASVVSVSNAPGSQGLVIGLSPGTSDVYASFQGLEGIATVTVSTAALVSLTLSPPGASAGVGAAVRFTAIAGFSDGSVLDVTEQAFWSSSNPMVATVSNVTGQHGLAITLLAGNTVISATFGGLTATAALAVQPANLVSLTVTPANATVALGGTLQFKATGTWSDGSQGDVTALVTWSSTSPSTASISNAPGSQGLARALAAGSTNITATFGNVMGWTALSVSSATLLALTVTPGTATIAVGTTQPFTATGLYSDNSLRDVTAQVAWSSAKTSVATIAPGGLATAVAQGSTIVTAALGGVSGSATLTVSGATLVQLALQPATATVSPGRTLQLKAVATFSDGSQQDVTALASWSSSDATVVTVSAGGLALAVAPGQADVKASWQGQAGLAHLTVPMVTLVSIAVTPAMGTVGVGASLQLTATGTYSDGSTQNLTATASWSSALPGVATVAAGGRATGVAVGTTTVTAMQNGISGSASLSVTAASLVSIEVSPQGPVLAKGTSVQLTATGLYSDGSVADLTFAASWSSSRTSVATVAPTGLVSAVAVGTASVSASFGGLSGSTTVTVTGATLTAIDVAPQGLTLPKGLSRQYTAAGLFSDGSLQDLTTACAWSSSAPMVAGVSNSGLVTTLATGSTSISCTVSGVTGSAQLTVGAATLTQIAVNPALPSLAKGTTLQLRGVGYYTDGTLQDVTQSCGWASSSASVVAVGNGPAKGLASGLAVGSATVSCTLGSLTGSTVVTVTAAALTRLEITPIGPTMALGTNLQLVATGIYSDGTTQDLTAQVTWTSSRTSVATVSNAAGSRGLAHAVGVGTSTVTAALGGVSAGATLTVTNATLDYIDIQPYYTDLELGTQLQLTATGYYSDGSSQDLTQQALWASDTPWVAPISNAPGSRGVVTGASLGYANITASFGGQQGFTYVYVSNGALVSIAVQPTTPTAAKGTSVQFTAWGIYSDGVQVDLTTQVVWTSSDGAVAQVASGPPTAGLARALGVGTTTIEATLAGIGGSTTLTVGAPTLSSIVVTPAAATVAQGGILQLVATGTWSDGSQQDLTTQVLWSSSMPTVAGVSNAAGSKGLAKGIALGTTTVSASSGGITGSTTLTVSNVVLQFIDVQPYYGSIAPGTSEQFTATGYYSDGSMLDLTSQVTWASDAPTVASITAGGLVTAVSAGSANITADFAGLTGYTYVTVQAPISIAVTPTNPNVRLNRTLQFTATAIFNDGSQQDVTNWSVWTSSAPAVATVSNVSGARGLATALSQGQSSIKATLSGVGGSTTMTVIP